MDQAQLEEFRVLLERRIVELKEELGTVAKPDVGDHVPGEYAAKFENFGDENSLEPDSDSPDEVENYEVNLAVTGDLERELHRHEAALQRIADGTYGKDLKTGADIAVERLRVNPAAETALPIKPSV
ncbi:MAG: TraR/DksA family transcriptional regulator [Candidatus Kerfeldbacteria bacterium]|nr:TraR/DksA family transcriptional regulator [Candidatus Kerfeldbacteria bacterium]